MKIYDKKIVIAKFWIAEKFFLYLNDLLKFCILYIVQLKMAFIILNNIFFLGQLKKRSNRVNKGQSPEITRLLGI